MAHGKPETGSVFRLILRLLTTLALLASTGLWSGAPAQSKPGTGMTLWLEPTATTTGVGAQTTAQLSFQSQVAIEQLDLSVETAGVAVLTGRRSFRYTGIKAGDSIHVTIPYTAASPGEGSIAVAAQATGDGEDWPALQAELYLVSDQGTVLHGTNGFTALHLRQLRLQREAKTLTADQYRRAERQLLSGETTTWVTPKSTVNTYTGNVTVTGVVRWTDSAGAKHPVREAQVQVCDDDETAEECPAGATAYTDNNGRYSITLPNQPGEGGIDPFIRVYARSTGVEVRGEEGPVQTIVSAEPERDVPDGTVEINLTGGNAKSNEKAFSVLDATVTGVRFGRQMTGESLPAVTVYFPVSCPGQGSTCYTLNTLYIELEDGNDWDVILHEYGHHLAETRGLHLPGGDHSYNGNLSEPPASKEHGTQLALSEGWATFFGVWAERSAASPGGSIPHVGDTKYTDTDKNGKVIVQWDLENLNTTGYGEDNEATVSRVLWDLVDQGADDGDRVTIADNLIWRHFDTTLSAIYQGLNQGESTLTEATRGAILERVRVAPGPIAPLNGARVSPASIPLFSWSARGGGPHHLNNQFVVEFFDNSWNPICSSPSIAVDDDSRGLDAVAASYTPDQATWDLITLRSTPVYWTVTGMQTDTPETGPYRSDFRMLHPLVSLSATPSSATLSAGAGQQLSASAVYSDGATRNVTASTAWSSSNTSIATVSSGGFVTGVSPGSATISGSYNGRSASVSITVNCTAGSGFSCPLTLSGSTTGSVAEGQERYYQFAGTAGTTYTVTLTPTSGDPDLYVYNPSRSQVGSADNGSGTDQVSFTAGVTGGYYIRVYGSSSATYTLSVTTGSGGGGGGCSDGNSFDCAIPLSSSANGSVSRGSSKYYKFSASAGTTYTLSLTPSSGDPDLYVYDPDRDRIGASGNGPGQVDRVTFSATVTGAYYVRVYGYSSANYALSVSTDDGGGGGCTDGSSFDCAILLTDSTSDSVSSGSYKYYKFSATAGAAYTITLSPNSGDPDLYIYDPAHNQVGSSTYGSGITDQVTFTAASGSAHYIRVNGFSSASYTLSVTTGGGGSGCSDGSSFNCAMELSGTTSGSVDANTYKYYKFYANAGTAYTVTLTPRSGDPDLTIYNPANSYVGSSGNGGTQVDQVQFTAGSSGYYYARVFGYSNARFTLSR